MDSPTKISASRVTAGLLAGGKSSRMGRDKALVDFRGEPLWKRQLGTLRELTAGEILISGRPDASYANNGYRVLEDDIKEAGPLAGVSSLLRAAANPLLLVLAIDMPMMTAAYLGSLLHPCTPLCGAVPSRGGIFEPLAAVYPKAASAVAEESLSAGRFSMQQFVRECESRELVRIFPVSDEDASLFENLNTPTDLAGQS